MNKFKVFGLYVLIVLTMFLVGGCGGKKSGSPVAEQKYCDQSVYGNVAPIQCPLNDCNKCKNMCDNLSTLYTSDKEKECPKCVNGTWKFDNSDNDTTQNKPNSEPKNCRKKTVCVFKNSIFFGMCAAAPFINGALETVTVCDGQEVRPVCDLGGTFLFGLCAIPSSWHVEVVDINKPTTTTKPQKNLKASCVCNNGEIAEGGYCCAGANGGPAPKNDLMLCGSDGDESCVNGTLLENGQCKCSNGVISAYGVCCPDGGPAPKGNLDYCDACDPSNPTCGYCDSNGNARKCADGRCCTDENCSNCTNSCDPAVPNCIVCDDNNKCLVCDNDTLCTDKNCCNCQDGDSAKNDEVCDSDEPTGTCIPGATCLNGTCNNKGECVCGNGQPASKNSAGVGVCCPYSKNSLKATQGPAPEGNVEYCCANGQTPWYDAKKGETLDDARPETGCCPWKIGGRTVLYSASSGPADTSCAATDCSTDSNYCVDSKGNCIPGDCKQ